MPPKHSHPKSKPARKIKSMRVVSKSMKVSPSKQSSPEYRSYQDLKLWRPENKVFKPEQLFSKKSKMFPLFHYLYNEVRTTYRSMVSRRNGENPFVHPLNVVVGLSKAGVKDEATLCAGLIHDLIEERVDLHKKTLKTALGKKFDEKKNSHLAEFEKQTYFELRQQVFMFCDEHKIPLKFADEIMTITKLLTRHKRHFYYRSLSQIFQYPNPKVKEKAIQIKLSDRLHNILTIEKFDNQERLYECFKSLFILNNTKKFIIDTYHRHMYSAPRHNSTELLFKLCGKATYEAFLNICQRCNLIGEHAEVKAMIHLAFKKYALEKKSVWEITKIDKKEAHLYRIFQGVVRKYDARLHQEWEEYETMAIAERTFSKKFFQAYHFTQTQIQAILDYKDAYALREIITDLLYIPEYYLVDFLCINLTHNGRLRR